MRQTSGMVTADSIAQTLKNLVALSPGSTLEIRAGSDEGLDLTFETASGCAIEGVWIEEDRTDAELLVDMECFACDVMDALERTGQAEW